MSYKKRLLVNFIVAVIIQIVLDVVFCLIFYYVHKRGIKFAFGSGLGAAGVLQLMFALLLFLSSEGVFIPFTFIIGKFVDLFRRDDQRMMPRHYYEYQELKLLKPKLMTWPYMVVGLVLTTVAIIISVI